MRRSLDAKMAHARLVQMRNLKMGSMQRIVTAAVCGRLIAVLGSGGFAQEPQNPSPMVEHTREHPRLEKSTPEGNRTELSKGIVLFVPTDAKSRGSVPLLVHFHGGHWLPELAAAKSGVACLSIQIGSGSGAYAKRFKEADSFEKLLASANAATPQELGLATVTAWSAGCGAVREILRHPANDKLIDRVILLDGIHTSYTTGKPGPLESKIDTAKLDSFTRFAREAIAGRENLLITHTEIFPGTFASTTETADWLLREVKVERTAVLQWGPMKTQQLSEAKAGSFAVQGFAGNSAPDHVDLLHALPDFLK